MNRGEHQRGRCPVAQELGEEEVGDLARIFQVSEPSLDGKGVALEPFEELLAVGSNDVDLRIVHVRVDEPRQDQLARVIDELRACGQGR